MQKKTEEKFKKILETMSEGYYETDLRGTFFYTNNEFCKIIDYEKEELIGEDYRKFFDEKTSDYLFKIFSKVYQKEIQFPSSTIYEAKTNKKKRIFFEGLIDLLYDSDGNKVGFYGFARDITKRIEAEQKLKESEKKHRNILENIEEGYFEVDLKGNLMFFNESFRKKLGYSKEEILFKHYSYFVDEEYRFELSSIFNDIFNRKLPKLPFQFKVIDKESNHIWVESSAYLIRDAEGKKLGFGGILRDITERKKIEKMNEIFTEELESQVVMRTEELRKSLEKQELYIQEILKTSHFKSEFMSIMSHELRTPMNAIIGFSDLLFEETFGPINKNQKEFLHDIKDSANHLLNLINQILDISKIEAGKLKLKIRTIDLQNFIKQIINTLKPLYTKKKLTFKVIGVKNENIINADPIRFKEILNNLLNNAIKFTLKGGITLRFSENEYEWIFDVIDTGIGIAKEDFSKIFKDFSRINHPHVISTEGTGLGLSITKRLVELHGGNIGFTSELGKGSIFTFSINKNLKVD